MKCLLQTGHLDACISFQSGQSTGLFHALEGTVLFYFPTTITLSIWISNSNFAHMTHVQNLNFKFKFCILSIRVNSVYNFCDLLATLVWEFPDMQTLGKHTVCVFSLSLPLQKLGYKDITRKVCQGKILGQKIEQYEGQYDSMLCQFCYCSKLGSSCSCVAQWPVFICQP